jgi:ribosome hibernation promoting factor
VQLSVTGRHIDITDSIREYAEKRIGHVKKYFKHIINAQLVLSVEKHAQVADLTVRANGVMLHAEEKGKDLYSSIDLVVDKIDKQLKRYRDRLKSHRTRHSEDELNRRYTSSIIDGEDVEQSVEDPRVIRSRSFAIKPMSLDEAVLQMDLMNQTFLVFENFSSNKVNVLYRRNDGNYGLVEQD